MRGCFKDFGDNNAHILASNDNAIVYKINNEIYFIPAVIRAMVCEDNTIKCWFDYPCEMTREDLIVL